MNVLSIALIILVAILGFMFFKKVKEDGFDEAKAWLVGLITALVATVADWWAQLVELFQ